MKSTTPSGAGEMAAEGRSVCPLHRGSAHSVPASPLGPPALTPCPAVVEGMSLKQVLNPVVIKEKYIVLWDSAKSPLRFVQSLKLGPED